VISCHLREIGGYLITVGYICYRRNNLVLIMNLRPGGITIVQQQGIEVLGVNLSPSVSVKDRIAVRPRVMLNACLTLSWLDKSFQPRSLRVQLRPDILFCMSAHPGCAGSQWRKPKVSG